MRKIQLYKKGFNVKNAVFDLKLALSQFRKNDIPSYLNSALHIFIDISKLNDPVYNQLQNY